MKPHKIFAIIGKNWILMLWLFGSLSASGQAKNLDSLKNVLKTAQGKSRTLVLLELCWGYRFVNADTARKFGLAALELSRKEGNKDYEAEALNNIGVTHEAQGNYDEAQTYELQALEIRRRLGDDSKTANTLNTLGIIHDEKGDYNKALSYYYDARRIYEKLKDDSKIAMVLTNIGIVMRAQKEYKSVVSNYRQALAIYERIGNKFGIAACHSNLGAVYLNIPNYDSAIYYSLLASKEFEEQNIRQFLPTTLSNAAIAFDRSNQFAKSKEYFLKAKGLHEEYNNKKELSFTLSQLARLESKMGNHSIAVSYAQDALAIAGNIKAMEQIMQAHQALAEANANAADFKNAYREHLLFAKAKDSLFQKEKAKALLELQTKYETERHKQEIAILNHENQLKSTELNRNYLVMVGLVLLVALLMLAFYFWRYRSLQKQKAIAQEQKERLRQAQINAVIESQEAERKRFASDLHDGMGQLVSALQLNIQSIKNKTNQEKTVLLVENSEQLLTDIQQEIRNIAFNLMPPVLVKEGLVPAVKELSRRIIKGSSLKVELTVHSLSKRFADVVEISVYRIVQELVSNILKHGNATQLSISFTGHDDEVILTIEDDGEGYDLAGFQTSTRSNGWRTIQTRLGLIGAKIDFDVIAGRKNNTVTISLPVAKVDSITQSSQMQNTQA